MVTAERPRCRRSPHRGQGPRKDPDLSLEPADPSAPLKGAALETPGRGSLVGLLCFLGWCCLNPTQSPQEVALLAA